jgi:hypothetical protein
VPICFWIKALAFCVSQKEYDFDLKSVRLSGENLSIFFLKAYYLLYTLHKEVKNVNGIFEKTT